MSLGFFFPGITLSHCVGVCYHRRMISWGTRRKLIIVSCIFAVGLIALGFFSVKTFYHPPSCSDGIQNQGETGIDCGGPCARLCQNQVNAPIVLWQRTLPVSQGEYNAVAYVENPNPQSAAANVPYDFKLYDSKGILVAERAGTFSIPPQEVVPVFAGAIQTGNRSPARTEFVFEASPVWTRVSAAEPDLQVTAQNLSLSGPAPLLTATVSNNSEVQVTNVPVVAIVYDAQDNARAASRTIVDFIDRHASAQASFSWPQPFGFTPARVEIIPEPYPGVNY